jgi:hypothetical protein
MNVFNIFPLKPFLRLFALALLPAFLLWWAVAHHGLMDVLRVPVGFVIENQFSRVQAKLYSPKKDNEWHVDTRLLMPKQPKKNKLLTLSIVITPLIIFSTGLPFLWALFIATPYKRIRNLVLGTGFLCVFILLALWLKSWITIADILIKHPNAQIFVAPQVIIKNIAPSTIWFNIAQTVGYSLNYIATFIAPLTLYVLLTRAWWQEFLPKKQDVNHA